MWGKALRVIPRIEKSEWDELDVVSKWLIATRAAVLIMTFISAAIAGILAFRAGQFHLIRWLALIVGLIMAHALNNMLNDLVDYRRGVDRDNYFRTQYGSQPLEQGLWNERQLLTYATVTGAIALAAGALLLWQRGPLAWILLALGVFFVVFYTWPLKYVGLGELCRAHRLGSPDDWRRILCHHGHGTGMWSSPACLMPWGQRRSSSGSTSTNTKRTRSKG
jgi:1,4-dihydroxy-2-naphthoate octaprenyltransferase